ncbi:hypothetical protein ACLKA7_012684 [Drosophila subpalustris]
MTHCDLERARHMKIQSRCPTDQLPSQQPQTVRGFMDSLANLSGNVHHTPHSKKAKMKQQAQQKKKMKPRRCNRSWLEDGVEICNCILQLELLIN